MINCCRLGKIKVVHLRNRERVFGTIGIIAIIAGDFHFQNEIQVGHLNGILIIVNVEY